MSNATYYKNIIIQNHNHGTSSATVETQSGIARTGTTSTHTRNITMLSSGSCTLNCSATWSYSDGTYARVTWIGLKLTIKKNDVSVFNDYISSTPTEITLTWSENDVFSFQCALGITVTPSKYNGQTNYTTTLTGTFDWEILWPAVITDETIITANKAKELCDIAGVSYDSTLNAGNLINSTPYQNIFTALSLTWPNNIIKPMSTNHLQAILNELDGEIYELSTDITSF